MTPAAKVTYLGALLMGLSIGVFFGFQNTRLVLETYYDARRLTAPMVLGDFAYKQYRHADQEHAKAALLTFVNFSEEMEKSRPEKTQKQNLANAYTRLALLEDSADNPAQSRVYITKARYWHTGNGGRDYSDSEMKAALKAVDAMNERLQR